MKYQLAKLYRGDRFFGYGISVCGLLLDDQVSTTVETAASEQPKVIATFNLSNEHSENQPRIDLDNPRFLNEFQIVIHPSKPLTAAQMEELNNVLHDFLARHQL
ncbi:hypothetical protein ABN154_26705 [Klebsiella michiganensis]|uniref:hypothetical protein n=1 Tax=Klebsiella michiganensis TaxID=1134687 RepID=UPI0032DA031E